MITFDKKLDRIAQRCDPLDQYRLTADKPHLHETQSRTPTPSNPEDPGALPRLQITQADADVANAVKSMVVPLSSAVSAKHGDVLG